MVTRLARCALAALALAGCSWDLPLPRIAHDAPDVTAPDVTAPDAPFDAPFDARDASDVTDAADARDASDAPDARDVMLDLADVRDVTEASLPDGAVCAPGDFRPCYSGDPSTMGLGYCRAGAQFCERPGVWAARCEGEITRDCAGRRCGSDGCEGSCGACPSGTVCDDTGTCVAAPACGIVNFTVPCGGGACPTNSRCSADGRCFCNANFEARLCTGERCPTTGCSGTDWWCAPAPFCGGGAILCPGNYLCPRWSLCDDATHTCLCRPGFTARRCDGVACTTCPGTEYECVPAR